MQIEQFSLSHHAAGTHRHLTSLHYGSPGSGKKCYIQSGLHASEIPGMLVSHYLRQALNEAENNGDLNGEIVLVPVANPIGLDQTLLTYQVGRFDLASGQNFNRGFPWVIDQLAKRIATELTQDEAHNTRIIRNALKGLLCGPTTTPLSAMQQRLSWLACDADILIDLHCDSEAIVHVYTHPLHLDTACQLGALMRAKAILYAELQGGESFDEVHTSYWIALAERFPDYPITTTACAGFTLELRGQLDVNHAQAEQDARCLIDFLRLHNILLGPVPALPRLEHQPAPLEGVEVLYAPNPGVIVYHKNCGELCQPGEAVVDIVDPLSSHCETLYSSTSGILFARQNRRYATAGMDVAYIAGHEKKRNGMLLSA